jgi:hypothetical protein
LRAERLVSLAQVAVDQVRIVSRDPLHELGWRHHHVEHEILTGRWTRVAPSVVALQNAPLTYEQRLWLGVLHASPRGCLSHGTACQVLGLEHWDSETIDVLTPKGDLVGDLPGFVFHQTRRDYQPWIHPGRAPATLKIETAALLAAERDQQLRRAIGRLAAVVQQRMTTAERLFMASLEISKLRHGHMLRLSWETSPAVPSRSPRSSSARSAAIMGSDRRTVSGSGWTPRGGVAISTASGIFPTAESSCSRSTDGSTSRSPTGGAT